MKSFKLSRFIVSAVIFGVVLGVYIFTMSQTVNLIDSGELALVGKNAGIAHPTGYPLYSILATIFTKLPVQSVLATNFMSAFWGAMSSIALFLIISINRKSNIELVINGLMAIAFAFSRTVWSISTETEVYSLEIFLNLIFVFFFIKASNTFSLREKYLKYFVMFAFTLGLAFTNHMITVLFVPSIVLVLLMDLTRNLKETKKQPGKFEIMLSNIKERSKTWNFAIIAFIAALFLYLYLPFRASSGVLPNWGNPVTFENFMRHITGWQYQTWMFEGNAEILRNNVIGFVFRFLDQSFFTLPVLLILGIVALVKRKSWKELVFWCVLILVNFLYAINYSIPDIDAYYLPLYAGSFIVAGFAFNEFLKNKRVILIPVLLFVIIGSFAYNYNYADKSEDYFAENMAYSILNFAPQNSVVILQSWDMFATASYIQEEFGYRNDVVLVDFNLLKRSWYVQQLYDTYPKVFMNSRDEMVEFQKQVAPFEKNEAYDPKPIEISYRAFIFSFIDNAHRLGIPVCGFTQWEPLKEQYMIIPMGYLYRIEPKNNRMIPNSSTASFQWDTMPNMEEIDDARVLENLNIIEAALSARVSFLYSLKLYDESIEYVKKLRELKPNEVKYIENHAILLVHCQRYEEALEIFQYMEQYVGAAKMQYVYQDLSKKIEAQKKARRQGTLDNFVPPQDTFRVPMGTN